MGFGHLSTPTVELAKDTLLERRVASKIGIADLEVGLCGATTNGGVVFARVTS